MARQSNLLDAILAHLGPFALLVSTIEHLPKKYMLVQSANAPRQPRWQGNQNLARKSLKPNDTSAHALRPQEDVLAR